MQTMTGTKTLLMRSPRRWMSARLVCARCTAAMICASAVASPVAADAHDEAAVHIHRAGKKFAAGFFVHRNGFAGKHGFVHGGFAFEHHTVHRHAVAGPQRDAVANLQFGNGNLDFLDGRRRDRVEAAQVKNFQFNRIGALKFDAPSAARGLTRILTSRWLCRSRGLRASGRR